MLDSESPLAPLVDSEAELRGEFRRRNSIWEQKSVNYTDEAAHTSDGWTVHRRLKTKVKLIKERQLEERLENKWWVTLYKMGYQEMNQGRHFRVLINKKGEPVKEGFVHVYARDEETVIVSLCKTSDKLARYNLRSLISEFSGLKGGISTTIKKFYGTDFKPKILWFLVTENIIWSDDDVELAKSNNIRRVTENELPYYTQLVEHLGRAARFQFLAEFLKDQAIPGLENVKVPATRGRLGGKQFYSFVTTPRHLLKIAFVNHRTLDDPEGYPTYQRLIQKGRLRDVGSFIKSGGYFPNNLLINFLKIPRFEILEKGVSADVHYGQLYLPNTYKSAWIIDGQHRLYGYANLEDKYLDEKLIVLAFDGLKKKEEADLFVTINHEQKSVPKNLLDDLEGQLKWESEDPSERVGALAARLLQQLNRDLSSPLYNRFTAEGLKSTEKSCLTIPQVKSAIKRSKLLGYTEEKGVYAKGALCGSTDNMTLLRAQKILSGFFGAIYNADISRWDRGREGRVCTNEGVQALILLLGEIFLHLNIGLEKLASRKEQQIVSEILPFVDPIVKFIAGGGARVDTYFTVPFGSGGPKEYFYRLAKLVREDYPNFSPADYGGWEVAQREDLKLQADEQIKQINIMLLEHIFTVFKRIYGEDNNDYWEKGVSNPEIKTKAYGKRVQNAPEDQGPYENYLDFIDLKKIVEKDRWALFRAIVDIPIDGEKGKAKNIDWMDRINELRRISAHPAAGRNYKSTDFPLIGHVYQTLKIRLLDFDYGSVAN